MQFNQLMRQFADVCALIPRRVKFDSIFAFEFLNITSLNRVRKLVHLIARVIDVKFTGHVMACPVEHFRQTVAQHAAACVAHVHRAGRVG